MEQKISANIDNPEGILDGMMQVAVCDEVFGKTFQRLFVFLQSVQISCNQLE